MSSAESGLPSSRRQVNWQALARRQGLTEVLRITDGITRGELASVMQDAAARLERQVAGGLVSAAGQAQIAQVHAATRGLVAASSAMWDDINRQVTNGVKDAANLAADQQLLRDFYMGLPDDVLQPLGDGLHFNALQGADDILSRRTNGYRLSQRVYRNSQATVQQVTRIIERGLVQQLSARQIAGLVRGFISPTTPGGASFAAMRLARTEINNAHHETTVRISRDRPWVTGYQWRLSGSHPKADECDTLAHDDHEGMGEGTFAKSNVPGKPHPQCLCFLLVSQVSEDRFQQELISGVYDRFLRQQRAA